MFSKSAGLLGIIAALPDNYPGTAAPDNGRDSIQYAMPKASAPPKDFESALQELESLVANMESGQLNLEAALAAYKRGSELTVYCQNKLDAADQQVRMLDNGVLKELKTGEGDA